MSSWFQNILGEFSASLVVKGVGITEVLQSVIHVALAVLVSLLLFARFSLVPENFLSAMPRQTPNDITVIRRIVITMPPIKSTS